jgi:hypothetical protein
MSKGSKRYVSSSKDIEEEDTYMNVKGQQEVRLFVERHRGGGYIHECQWAARGTSLRRKTHHEL